MEQRRRTAEDVFVCEVHAISDKTTIVQYGMMCQGGGFWVSSRATGKLQIAYVVIAEPSIQIVQQPVV